MEKTVGFITYYGIVPFATWCSVSGKRDHKIDDVVVVSRRSSCCLRVVQMTSICSNSAFVVSELQ